jgi:hypothetical protein
MRLCKISALPALFTPELGGASLAGHSTMGVEGTPPYRGFVTPDPVGERWDPYRSISSQESPKHAMCSRVVPTVVEGIQTNKRYSAFDEHRGPRRPRAFIGSSAAIRMSEANGVRRIRKQA